MKGLAIVLLLLPTAALAFESDAWLKRREQFTLEAARMRESYSNVVAKTTEPAENVFVPVEVHPDGAVKISISAKRAQIFLKEDVVWAADVVVRQCDERGSEQMRIEAERFLFDRHSRRGWAEGPARVVRGKTVFSGNDVYLSTEDEYVLSLRDSKLDSKDLKIGGAL